MPNTRIMRLSFYGACHEVTGSNILLESANHKVLLDCGLFQGPKLHEEKNYEPFGYRASSIDAVVLCHAHLDHVGRVSKLVKEGFQGKIYSTGPTKELVRLVLEDNEKLMREESKRENFIPLYSVKEVRGAMEQFITIAYEERTEIVPGFDLTFHNAGHILGSCVAQLEIEGKTIAYTSDLGNSPSLLLDSPTPITHADYLICESTYGGRVHEDIQSRMDKISAVIDWTIKKEGVLLIPSFAIERTQELLHDLDHFCSINGCVKPTFYLDSPLAQKVTKVYSKYPEFLSEQIRNEHLDNDFFGLGRVHITSTVDESKQINDAAPPKVIIAGAGMMNGGRILHHAKRYLPEAKNTLLIVGYQAVGSLGRIILSGAKEVRILGERVEVNASVKAIGSYSAHADQPQLLTYVENISGLKKVFLVHGEEDQSRGLGEAIFEKLNLEWTIPDIGKVYDL